MPQRHSKNNNYLAFFTHEEKLKLGYGTQRERLGRDSIRPFDPCCLCIKHLIHPLFCQKGHLLCNECILECLLTQKKDIERWIAETSHQNLKMRRELHHDICKAWLVGVSHEIITSAVDFRVWNLDHIDYKSHKSSDMVALTSKSKPMHWAPSILDKQQQFYLQQSLHTKNTEKSKACTCNIYTDDDDVLETRDRQIRKRFPRRQAAFRLLLKPPSWHLLCQEELLGILHLHHLALAMHNHFLHEAKRALSLRRFMLAPNCSDFPSTSAPASSWKTCLC